MPVHIRPVRPDDYPALAAIADAAFPGVPHTAEELLEEDAPTPPILIERWVADLDGRVVGTASYFQNESRYDPRKFWLDAFVHPDWQGHGIGAALFDHVMGALAPYDPVSVRTFTREDIPRGLPFLERRGFVEGKRTWESHLNLEAADLSPWAGAEARVQEQGIVLRSLPELQAQAGWEARLLELYNAIQVDIPDIDPATPLSPEQFDQTYLGSGSFLAEGHFIALDGGRWVGMSSLWKRSEFGTLSTGVTGVLQGYRGRGIAMALKMRGIAFAREQGVKVITTYNASTNRPMLSINERLGFTREPAWIHLIRTHNKKSRG
ncbi:MAG TPA: GNAT family N-acetyltransferase [Symbiobacteriaceae bacterium]|nr:GNAT family N-acetyltransferase [Symbiobacteriaceae bacterium]